MGVLCLSLFCFALLCVHSSFAIILKMKKKLVALLLLTNRYIFTINVYCGSSSRCRGLGVVSDCGISDHTHLLFNNL